MAQSRQAHVEDDPEDIEMGVSLADVPLDTEHFIPAASGGTSERAGVLLAQFDRKKLAASIAVPTDDRKVRLKLRELGEPITLFGERPQDRRDRLREFLTRQVEQGTYDDDMEDVEDEQQGATEEYFTEGSSELLKARQDIANYSVPRAKQRIAFQKAESSIMLRTHVKFRKAVKEQLADLELFGSQNADARPLGKVRFSPDGTQVAVGAWGGTVKLLTIPNLEDSMMLRGHTEVVTGISWYPAQASQSAIKLATGGGEGNIHLWGLVQDTPNATLSGHEARVAGVDFHPSGRYLASASYDCTWRLWDVETSVELLVQEGHASEVHTVSINGDGSLIASGGLDSVGRIWDLRTGRIVMYINSHIQPIYALDWSPDSYRVLSGSADGFIKCWDVRAVKESASIAANTNGITDVRWFKGSDGPGSSNLPPQDESGDYLPKRSGTFVVSGGFDHEVKVFSADDWALCKTLKGHSKNVNGVDISSDSKWIVSSGIDRTVKLWGRSEGEGISGSI